MFIPETTGEPMVNFLVTSIYDIFYWKMYIPAEAGELIVNFFKIMFNIFQSINGYICRDQKPMVNF